MTQSTQETEKENKRKGQYSLFYKETNISEWFYTPKEQLVLINEGIPISIPLSGIKHSMLRCCKSDLQFSVKSSVNVATSL